MKVWYVLQAQVFQRPYLLHQVKQLIVATRRATPSQHGCHPHRPSYRPTPTKDGTQRFLLPNQHQLIPSSGQPSQPCPTIAARIQSVLLTFFTYFNLGRD